MATIVRRTPVGTDIQSFGGPWQIAGVTVDNPSGSWLSIPNVGTVPPFTMGWGSNPSPTIMAIDVLFVDSPSGTPSELIGDSVTVTISSVPVDDSSGFPSGASEFQQPGRGNVQHDLHQLIANESGANAFDAVAGRFVGLGMSVSKDVVDGLYGIRVPVVTQLFNVTTGLLIFPPIIITPEQPYSGMIRPIPRETLTAGGVTSLEYRATTAQGGGATNIIIYVEYYVVAE